jgi:hypothetical protein
MTVGSPGGVSMEELLSQLPEDVIGPGFNKEDPGKAPFLLHSIYREGLSPGASSEESVKQRCVLKHERLCIYKSCQDNFHTH